MNRPLILTFVSEDYIPVGLHWLDRVKALQPDADIEVIALDEATANAFDSDIVRLIPVPGEGLASLWEHRIKIICDLLDRGVDVLHSDVDAIWLQDPIPYILGCESEMVFSQGTIWPPDVHARHKIVLCCGLFYLKNTPMVRAFMQEVDRRMLQDKDDQISINRLVSERGVEWKCVSPYYIPFRDQTFLSSRQPIFAKDGELPSLAVLPHHLFPRLIDELSEAIKVAHPLSPKNCAQKIEILIQLGLWR